MNFDDYLKQKLQDPEFRREWDQDEPAFQVVRLLVGARTQLGWTQAELAKRMETDQANVSRAETTGRVTPDFLVRFLAATGGSARLTVRYPGSPVTRVDLAALARRRTPTAAVGAMRGRGQKQRKLRVKHAQTRPRLPQPV